MGWGGAHACSPGWWVGGKWKTGGGGGGELVAPARRSTCVGVRACVEAQSGRDAGRAAQGRLVQS